MNFLLVNKDDCIKSPSVEGKNNIIENNCLMDELVIKNEPLKDQLVSVWEQIF